MSSEHSSDDSLRRQTTKNELRQQFAGCESPKHVEKALKPLLKLAHEEADLTAEEWEHMFFSLQERVEFGDASWLNEL